ncbi:hypothetical protein ZIOFF_014237 [Zingiber officinale]|uniref:Methyltransferase-like protein 1 n=1 Tax=Zingiber officinale TaxID=94328 RepID=A0A8J5HBC5_ZINOF|nr:hypothetical protein ZIOFF_014237 [Zingiber officinale]
MPSPSCASGSGSWRMAYSRRPPESTAIGFEEGLLWRRFRWQMEGSEFSRIRSKRGVEEREVDEQDSGRRKASDVRNESKKRSGGTSIITSDNEDNYSVRSDFHSKIPQRNMDERIEKRSGENYRDRESNCSRKRSNDGNEWDFSRKPSSKASAQDNSDNVNRSKVESSCDAENEKLHERDSRYPVRKDSGKGKNDPGQNEHIQRRRWDEVEVAIKRTDEDNHTGRSDLQVRKASDSNKRDFLVDTETDFRNESGEGKIKVLDASDENGTRSSNRDDREGGSERGRSWKRLEVHNEENRLITSVHRENRSNAVGDDRKIKVSNRATGSTEDAEQYPHRYSSKQQCEKGDKQRQEIDSDNGNCGEVETWEKSTNMDRDNHSQMRDNEKSLNIKGSLTPCLESYGIEFLWEQEKIFKDHRKRVKGRQDPIDGDEFSQVKEWEMPSHEHERFGSDNIQIRPGYRKDNHTRPEAAKGSSTFNSRNENSDSIKIRPNRNLDFGEDDSVSTFPGRKSEMRSQQDFASGESDEEWGYLAEDKGKTASAYGDDSQEEQSAAQSSSDNMQSFGNSQGTNPFNRGLQQGPKGGARGVDLNMLAPPPNVPPIPPLGPTQPRFPPNIGIGPGQSMHFNQPGLLKGVPPNVSAPGFNVTGSGSCDMQQDKASAGWAPPRTNGSSGTAPSRGEQNDYSQNYVDTGMRPQNFIRKLELTSVVEDYPKLRELIQRKDEIVAKSVSPPTYYKCDLYAHALSPEFFGTKFNVILVDPPWEEYVHRAPGITDYPEYWTFEQIRDLKIEAIADTPSFILWVGDGVGLEQGRQYLKKCAIPLLLPFVCEDVCWVKTNKNNATPGLRHDSHTLFQHSKEHCLMGIKGTVRHSTDGHIIHANIDTDVIIAEGPNDGSTKKPEDMYRIIEHFALGRRRLELFGEDHNIRSGWLTAGKELPSSNFNAEAYIWNFYDKDRKVWQGSGGRNPPPDAPHLVLTTPEIENLRKLSTEPMNPSFHGMMNADLPDSELTTAAPWSSSPMVGFRRPDGELMSMDGYHGYGFNATFPQPFGDHMGMDPCRTNNFL